MGSPKPLLPFGETTFLGHLLEQFLTSRASPVVVVLGHEADAVLAQVPLGEAGAVVNPDYRQGMLSTIRAGLRALQHESVAGALICPVDHPQVSAALVDLLIGRFEETKAPIVIPVHHGRRGHPVLFSQTLFEEIQDAPDKVGARQVVWDHANELLEVSTEDRGIIADIDTPEQYKDLMGS